MAVRAEKPLVFFCAGEPAALNSRYRIGVRAEPSAERLAEALDEAFRREDWEFADAWDAVAGNEMRQNYVTAIDAAAKLTARGRSN
jgi:hypothetical protein